MKKSTLVACLLNFALIAAVHAAPLDQIVAVVNDDVVTQSEVDQSLSVLKMQISQAHQPMPPRDEMQKQVINQLVNKKLQMQIAKQVGIKVADTEVDQIIKKIAAQNNVSVDTLYKRIAEEGVSATNYRKELQEQLTIQRIQQQEAGGRLTVTPEEINRALKSVSANPDIAANNLYHLEDILIPVEDEASSEQVAAARAKAQKLVSQLQQSGYQKKLVQDKSHYQYADLGWMQLNDMPSAFVEDVARMSQNSIAGPIQTGNGFHVLHLAQLKTKASANAGSDLSRKQVENRLLQQKFLENAERWVAKMRSQAYIVINQTS